MINLLVAKYCDRVLNFRRQSKLIIHRVLRDGFIIIQSNVHHQTRALSALLFILRITRSTDDENMVCSRAAEIKEERWKENARHTCLKF